ncbi:MAG: VCBS repeat-containing protein [Verrucomicrobiota bacterium]
MNFPISDGNNPVLQFLRCVFLLAPLMVAAEPWTRHTIDDSSEGADGVRLGDINGDGLLDIATGWEEGGVTRVYLNPGPTGSRSPWPQVTVGDTPSAEDAVFADINGDGVLDVVVCCEGGEKAVHVFLAPKEASKLLESNAWKKVTLLESKNRMRWMFALPLEIDGKPPVELVAAGKDEGSWIGYFDFSEGIANATWREWAPMGWIMSMIPYDFDDDGDLDVVFTDRRHSRMGSWWMENPGEADAKKMTWSANEIVRSDNEFLFAKVGRLLADGEAGVLLPVKEREVWWVPFGGGKRHRLRNPESAGRAKAVAFGDLDGESGNEIVISGEGSQDGRSGVMGMKINPVGDDLEVVEFDISGPEGIKFDRLELIDLDGDGDLDVLTCEERAKLGVIWYENPANP